MRYLKTILIKIVVVIFIFGYQKAHAQFRKYSNEFLNIGSGARGIGMGTANAASANDATAGYWNPAGLTHVKKSELSLMHSEYFGGIGKYDFIGLAFPGADNKRTIGASVIRFAVDDIPNTLFLVNPDGSLNYNNIKTFSSADYALLLSYAQKLRQTENTDLSFGVNAKVIHRSVGKFAKAWGFGLDAGLSIQKPTWRFGIVAKDITTTFNTWAFNFTDEEKEILYLTNNDIPVKSSESTAPRLTLATAKKINFGKKTSLLAEVDLDVTFDGKRNTVVSADPVSVEPKIGLELNINDVVFVRGGIHNFQRGLKDGDTTNLKKVWIYQPTVGAGFKIAKTIGIDYTFANLANQSNPLFSHIISLNVMFNNRKSKTKNY
ncbi:MAG: PorV/PorQ family protein [Chitinophagaceae bacterium]|nr:MAG: PorV/PorQ family protein [Chitinophagaceae bacterium]